MKKLFTTIGASLLFLFGASVVCFVLKSYDFPRIWHPLAIGCMLIVFSSILFAIHIKSHKLFFIINMIAMGFLVRTWHLFKEYDLKFYVLVLISVGCVLYLVLFYFLSYIPVFNNHYRLYLILFIIISVVIYLVIIFLTKTDYLSTYGYYMIMEIGFLLALSVYTESKKELARVISLSTFMVVLVAIIIILLMLEGDLQIDFFGEELDLVSPKNQKKLEYEMYNIQELKKY